MSLSWNRRVRKLHRWGAIIACLPIILVIGTGLLLQVKKKVSWIQPPTTRGVGDHPTVEWATVLQSVASVPEAHLKSWSDIDRLDVRPSKGIVKVRGKNRWEVQVDIQTGAVLDANYRRSDLIESLHDGSFFTEPAKLWIFLPNGILLLGLWFTGIYLWWLPIGVKRKKARAKNAKLTNKVDA